MRKINKYLIWCTYLYGTSGYINIVATVEAVAVLCNELMLVVAIGSRVAPGARQFDLCQPRCVYLEARMHVLTERAVLWRRCRTFQCIAFQYRLHWQVTHSRVFFEIALRFEFIAQSACKVTHVFARRCLRKITWYALLLCINKTYALALTCALFAIAKHLIYRCKKRKKKNYVLRLLK